MSACATKDADGVSARCRWTPAELAAQLAGFAAVLAAAVDVAAARCTLMAEFAFVSIAALVLHP